MGIAPHPWRLALPTGERDTSSEGVRARRCTREQHRELLVARESIRPRDAQSYFKEALPVLPRRFRLSLQQPTQRQTEVRGFG